MTGKRRGNPQGEGCRATDKKPASNLLFSEARTANAKKSPSSPSTQKRGAVGRLLTLYIRGYKRKIAGELYGGSLLVCSPCIPQFVLGTSCMMTCTWSAVTPISSKARVIPRISVAFWSSVFPAQVSTMTTGMRFTSNAQDCTANQWAHAFLTLLVSKTRIYRRRQLAS